MATVSDLKFTIVPGDSLDTIKVRIKTKIRFNEFDRETKLNYRRSFELLGVPPGGVLDLPTVPAGGRAIETTPGPIEFDVVTVLTTLVPVDNSVDAADPGVVDDQIEFTDVFEIPRSTADEDSGAARDELQVRCELEPALPQTETFLSSVVTASLP